MIRSTRVNDRMASLRRPLTLYVDDSYKRAIRMNELNIDHGLPSKRRVVKQNQAVKKKKKNNILTWFLLALSCNGKTTNQK